MERVWLGSVLVLGLIACNSSDEEIRSKATDPSVEFNIVLPPLDTDYPDPTTDTDTDTTDTTQDTSGTATETGLTGTDTGATGTDTGVTP